MRLTRDEALILLRKYIKNERMIAHCIASEAVMKAIAKKLGKDEESWGMAGLLHDLDVEITNVDSKLHGLKTVEILAEYDVDAEILDAIKMHNFDATGIKRSNVFHHALAAGETITGMIVATTLVYPDKKIASVKPKSILKRMKQSAFAASVSRETIMECEKTGIPLNEFAELCLKAMVEVSDEISL